MICFGGSLLIQKKSKYCFWKFIGFAYQEGKDIVLRFIIEYIVAEGILASR
jgi:hypothetical protein